MLCLDTYLLSRQTRFTQSHVDVFDTRRLLDILHNARQLTDTGITQLVEVTQPELAADRIDDVFI